MSSMQKMKVFFGLAEDESDSYDDTYRDESYRKDTYRDSDYDSDAYVAYDEETDAYAAEYTERTAVAATAGRYRARRSEEAVRHDEPLRAVGAQSGAVRLAAEPAASGSVDGYQAAARSSERRSTSGPGHVVGGNGGTPAVRGALAIDDQEPVRRSGNPFVEDGHPLGTISTLHPRTYNEARTIGERYREGNPVIMNLTEMSDADAKRLVDFSAGLAFALHGAIDKVTSKVFLLSPPDVDVSAEDRRRIAETGFYRQR